jgi:hypothetical protein
MDLDPTPDRLLSSLILRMQKKYLFSYFFRITGPQALLHQSKKLNFLLNFCVKILFCRNFFSPPNTFMRKGRIRIRIMEARKHVSNKAQHQRRCENKAAAAKNSCNENSSLIDNVNKKLSFVTKPVPADERSTVQ